MHPSYERAFGLIAIVTAVACGGSGSGAMAGDGSIGGRTSPDGAGVDGAVDDGGAAANPSDAAARDAGGDGRTGPERDAGGAPPVGPDPACTTNGCVRAASHLGDFSRAEIEPYLAFGVSIDNGYSVYLIRLWSGGRETLATVTVPFEVPPPANGFHIVANSHGTTGVDDPCSQAGEVTAIGLAGLFGARGAIGVAPEYPGLGTPGVHPYLVADVEGRAVLDSLRATHHLAGWLGVPISERYAAVGLSQGGHATIAAAALHSRYAPELDIRAFGAAAPAAVWEEHWRASIAFDGPHVPYLAMVVYAWMAHYGWDGPSPWATGRRAAIEDAFRNECVVSSTGQNLTTRLGTLRYSIFAPAFLDAYGSGEWGAYGAFGEWFEENRLGPYEQTAPLRIYQGSADAIVPETWTADLVEALRAGGVTVDYEVVFGGTHTDVAFGFVAESQHRTDESIAWVFAALDG